MAAASLLLSTLIAVTMLGALGGAVAGIPAGVATVYQRYGKVER